jgi:3-deoxy-manno-octulosonate cytidylyltransferase (CMP-KDO synthetase)
MPNAPQEPRAVAIIPARYGSSRVPGKPLADIGGRPMIEHVLRRARRARLLARVIVATDDERIREAVSSVGEVVMTRADHESGSDRVAEVAGAVDCDVVVNIQGDLPLLDASIVDRLIETLRADTGVGIATVAVAIRSREEFENPAVVKVVRDARGRALYFSRSPVPYDRDRPGGFETALHHVGLYAYRRETLLEFAALAPTRLERTEKLEQLRALENGIGIAVALHDGEAPLGVDTDEDLARAREAIAEVGEG